MDILIVILIILLGGMIAGVAIYVPRELRNTSKNAVGTGLVPSGNLDSVRAELDARYQAEVERLRVEARSAVAEIEKELSRLQEGVRSSTREYDEQFARVRERFAQIDNHTTKALDQALDDLRVHQGAELARLREAVGAAMAALAARQESPMADPRNGRRAEAITTLYKRLAKLETSFISVTNPVLLPGEAFSASEELLPETLRWENWKDVGDGAYAFAEAFNQERIHLDDQTCRDVTAFVTISRSILTNQIYPNLVTKGSPPAEPGHAALAARSISSALRFRRPATRLNGRIVKLIARLAIHDHQTDHARDGHGRAENPARVPRGRASGPRPRTGAPPSSCLRRLPYRLHIVDGELTQPKLPLIPGHQIVGIGCRRTAEGVGGMNIGDRLGVPWLGWTCGECRYCRSAGRRICATARNSPATTSMAAMRNMRWRTRDSASRSRRDTPDEQAAPLLCAGLIGFRSYRITGDAKRIGFYGFGAAAHELIQVARFEGREIYAFTRPGDDKGQAFARSLGAAWAGGGTDERPAELDAAIIFAPAGELVPIALAAVRKGGVVVCAGIHMSDIPSFPYELLWNERSVRSVANLTKADGEAFLTLAPRVPIRTTVHVYPLEKANEALDDLRAGRFTGSAVLSVDASD